MGVQMEQYSIRRNKSQVRGFCRMWCAGEECCRDGDACLRSFFTLAAAVNAIANDDDGEHTYWRGRKLAAAVVLHRGMWTNDRD